MSSAVLLDREYYVWLAKNPSSSKLRVVLAPSFYIVKNSNIRFESAKKAQKAAASIFEESLPNGEFVFETHKRDEGGYIFFAIDYEGAAKKAQEIAQGYRKIEFYTAQTVFFTQTFPLSTKEGRSLIKLDETILSSVFEEQNINPIDISKLNFSKKLYFRKSSKINGKSTKALVVSSAIFALTFGGDFVYNLYKTIDAQNRLEKYKESAALPATKMELKSSVKSLSKIKKEQDGARLFIKRVSSFGFSGQESVKSLKIEKNGYEVEINTQRGEEIKKHIAERFKVEGVVSSENSLYLKASL